MTSFGALSIFLLVMSYKYYLHAFGLPFRVWFDDDGLPDTAESYPEGKPQIDNLLCLDVMFTGEPHEVDESTFWAKVAARRVIERSGRDED